MPPRLPARSLTALPFSNGAVASSSTLPPASNRSPKQHVRNLHTVTRRPCARSQSQNSRREAPTKRSFHSSTPKSASAKDPYQVLGLSKDASAADIKKTYYQLAKKWHPDQNTEKGAHERFQEIQSAYEILGTPEKRSAYDKYGSASQQDGFDPNMFGGGAGGFGGFQDFGSAFGGRPGDASDLFSSLFGGAFGGGGGGPFGGGGARSRPTRGDDLEAVVTLSFLEACQGASRKILITPVVDCAPCTGSGLKPGQSKTTCATCRGSGQQTFQVQGMFMSSTCQSCGGAGNTIPRGAKCGQCDGVGRVKERREVDVDVPGGIEDGMKVKIPSAGDMPLSSSGPPGDLYVRVNVRSSPLFRRQGTNIYHDAKVPLQTALLGGKVRIPTLEGEVDVKVREGTQNGEEAVLKGRGVKNVYGPSRGRGDLIVGWNIQIPRSLSPFQKKILQAFADDVEGKDPNVYFGTPPAPDTASSNGTATSHSHSKPSSPPFSPTYSKTPETPFVETESRRGSDQAARSQGNEIPVDDKQAEDVAAKTNLKSKEEKRTVTEGQSVDGSERPPVDENQAETMSAKTKSKSKKERMATSKESIADSADPSKVEKETLTSGTADSKTAEPVMSTANQATESAAAEEAQVEPEQEREAEEEPKKAATG